MHRVSKNDIIRRLSPARPPWSNLQFRQILPWIPMMLILAVELALWALPLQVAVLPSNAVTLLNLLFSTLVSLLIAALAARTYLSGGASAVLWLGDGMLAFGLASLISGSGLAAGFYDMGVTIYSSAIFVAGFCNLLGAVRLSVPRRGARWHFPLPLVLHYAAVVAAVTAVSVGAYVEIIPPFFVQGAGPTLVRQLVLGAAICQFIAAAVLISVLARQAGVEFLRWYGMGLALIAVGLMGILLIRDLGSPLAWVGRSTQNLGGVYLLVAVTMAVRRSGSWSIPIEELRETHRRYSSLVDTCPDAILVHREGCYLFANPAAARLFGADSPADLVGKSVLELVHPASRQIVSERIRQVHCDRTPSSLRDVKVLRLDGQTVDVEAVGAYVSYEGRPAVQVVLRDMTERTRSYQALRESEERFRAAVENIPDLFIIYDALRRIEYVNPAGERVLGRSLPALAGKRDEEVWDADLTRGYLPQLEQAYATASPVCFECTLRLPGERCLTHVASYVPVLDQSGSVRQMLGIMHDITARKMAEQAVHQAGARLRRFVEGIPIGVTRWRVDGSIVDANDRFLDIVGCTREDLVAGRLNWMEMTPPEFAEADRQALEELRSTGANLPYEKAYRHRDGSCVPVLVSSVMTDETYQEGIAFTLDLSEQKQAAAELQKAKASAEAANRAKDDFLAVLGHELRNPLAPIRNSVALLTRSGFDDADLENALRMIDRQVGHMARLIDDLLDVSRISCGKIMLKRQEFDLLELTRSVLSDHRTMLDSAGVHLNFSADSEPLWALGDSARITQIIGNLLTNAVKFTDRGGWVTVELLKRGEREAVIRVRDTGIGMDDAMLERIFTPFAQADRSLDRSRGGLGLGLALIKGFVALHGGTVTANSPGLGKGSDFVVQLPILTKPSRVRNPKEETTTLPVRPRRVLVIEDNGDAADSIRMYLEFAGHSVQVAHTGPEGLVKARAQRPEVVLCDIGLPGGMDGYAVGRALRNDPELRSVQLIAMTGYGQDEDRRRAQEAGFDHHLTKPADLQALERLISR